MYVKENTGLERFAVTCKTTILVSNLENVHTCLASEWSRRRHMKQDCYRFYVFHISSETVMFSITCVPCSTVDVMGEGE